MKIIANYFRHLKGEWNNKAREQRANAIKRAFYAEEKDGCIFVLHNEIAIYKFSPENSVSDIVAKLNEIRNNAIAFELD